MKTSVGISRRDFLNSTMIGAGAALLTAPAPFIGRAAMASVLSLLPEAELGTNWYGFGGVGDYQASHGNTPEALTRSHSLRDSVYDWSHQDVIDT